MISAQTVAARPGVPVEALFILKWGGELTKLGEAQAEFLGGRFRNSLYPGDEDGGGVLRLHSTYRHDLKIYSSDEGRVQMTAAAFARGCSFMRACALNELGPVAEMIKEDPALISFGDWACDRFQSRYRNR